MNDKTLEQLSGVLCKSFHRQKWDYDCEEPSEINKTAWKNCAKDLIDRFLSLSDEEKKNFN